MVRSFKGQAKELGFIAAGTEVQAENDVTQAL